jgi:putative phage-type endonuclease
MSSDFIKDLPVDDPYLRKNFIGSSDAPIIMGVSPWCTPYELYNRKLGLSPNPDMSHAMQRGIELEPLAREYYEVLFGVSMKPRRLISKEIPWMIGTFDGIDDTNKLAIEIKCPGKKDHEIAKNGKVPDKYYAQLQHLIAVANLSKIDYVSYSQDITYVLTVYKDQVYIDNMLMKEREFYECLVNRTPPPLSENDFEIKDDKVWSYWSQRYKDLQSEKEKWEKDLERCKTQLLKVADGRNCKGNGLKVQKIIRKGNIDYANILEIANVDLEKYRKGETEFFKISTIEE